MSFELGRNTWEGLLMSLKDHFELLSVYNQWMNSKIYLITTMAKPCYTGFKYSITVYFQGVSDG